MWSKYGLYIYLFFNTMMLYSQNEYNIWYFGEGAGLDFNSGQPQSLANSKMSTFEGSSSISDSAGNLLFYTDGVTIWNKNHDTMQNGFGLFGHNSSTQSVLIAKQPGSLNIYYVFTTDAIDFLTESNRGVSYSLVDLSLNNGLGAVISKNNLLFKSSNEKISAVHHANKKDIWIASLKRFSDSVYCYLLNENGISNPVISKNPGNKIGFSDYFKGGHGQMKYASNGKKLAYTNVSLFSWDSGKIHLMDFNSKDGTCSNPITIIDCPFIPYGLEFSYNGDFLYVNGKELQNLYQIPVKSLVDSVSFYNVANKLNSSILRYQIGQMQLGPDRRIYISSFYDSFISVIENPDSLNCKFAFKKISLKGKKSMLGFPSMIQSQLYYSPVILNDTICLNDTVNIAIQHVSADSVYWDFGDSKKQITNNTFVHHVYKDSGTYLLKAKIFFKNGKDTVITSFQRVEYIKKLILPDTILCEGDSLTLNIYDNSIKRYSWSDSNNEFVRVLKFQGQYSLNYSNNMCKRSDTMFLKIGFRPSVYIGNDTVFCGKFLHTISTVKNFKSYLWNTGSTNYYITTSQSGNYYVSVLDSNSCKATDTISIESFNRPKFSYYSDSLNCKYMFYKAERQLGINYLWSNGDTGVIGKFSQKGTYFLFTQNKFCNFKDSLIINNISKPELDLGNDTNLCRGPLLLNLVPGNYLWENGSNSNNRIINKPGLYWLKMSTGNCSVFDSLIIKGCDSFKCFIPNSFTPNNDNLNGVFKIEGVGISSLEITIFNRWGELVFKGEAWDGKYKGEICMQDVYTYIAKIKDVNGLVYYYAGLVHLLN